MQQAGLPRPLKRFCVGLLMAVCFAQISSLSAAAAAKAAQVDLQDGEYTVEVTLEGGSGRATILSPAVLTVREGKAYARIEWSSSSYDYMKVEDEIFKPIQQDGNSAFEIPVAAFDTPMTVIGDTTAMSAPHEVEYALTFASDSISKVRKISSTAFAGGAVVVLAVAITVLFQNYRKRGQGK